MSDRSGEIKEQSQKLTDVLRKFSNLLIFIKGSPDPDAIASSCALKHLCELYGIMASVTASRPVALHQNQVFIDKLKLPFKVRQNIGPEDYDGYVILDHPSADMPELAGIPCAVHIDHHEKVKQQTEPLFSFISTKAGSVSTLMALLFKESGIELPSGLAAALLFGLQTDTDDFFHLSEADREAAGFLTPLADMGILNKISGVPVSESVLRGMKTAEENMVLYKDWLVSDIGFTDEKNRDTVAIVADRMLKKSGADVVFIGALVRKKHTPKLLLDVSVRASKSRINLNSIIKNIALTGGARKYKGAFQVDMDFFRFCEDEEAVRKMIFSVLVSAVKNQKDAGLAHSMKNLISKLSDSTSRILYKAKH